MYRIGVIGLGRMGTYMVNALMHDPRFIVTVVWDTQPEAVMRIQQQFSHLSAAPDAERLVSQDNVDLVYIATPPETHVDYCHLALDHRKPILCEKPLSVDFGAAEKLVQRAREESIPNGVNFLFGVIEPVMALQEAVQSCEVGDLIAVEIRAHFPVWPRPWQQARWLSNREQGGFVREVFSHYIYLTERLCGTLQIEWCNVTRPASTDMAETGIMALLTSQGVPIRLMGTTGGNAPEHLDWTLYGSRRSYRLWNWNLLETSTGESWKKELSALDTTLGQSLDGLEHMMQGKPYPLGDFAAGLRVQQIIESLLV